MSPRQAHNWLTDLGSQLQQFAAAYGGWPASMAWDAQVMQSNLARLALEFLRMAQIQERFLVGDIETDRLPQLAYARAGHHTQAQAAPRQPRARAMVPLDQALTDAEPLVDPAYERLPPVPAPPHLHQHRTLTRVF